MRIEVSIVLAMLAMAMVVGIGLGILSVNGPDPSAAAARIIITIGAVWIALMILDYFLRTAIAAINWMFERIGTGVIALINYALPLKSKTDDPRRLYWEKKLNRFLKRKEREASEIG